MTTASATPPAWLELLDFWFAAEMRKRWFATPPALDEAIRTRFEPTWQRARAGALDHWLADPDGALALVIALDQLPLNMYRGRPDSFASAGQALAAAGRALALAHDRRIPLDRLAFLFLPVMHSEDLADQDRSVALFRAAGLAEGLRWAEHHRELVRRFGRFPHRNAILGRTSTAEELAYLASPGAFLG